MTEQELTFTNSSLTTARECLRKFHLRYGRRLKWGDGESEALEVGTAWHKIKEAAAKGLDWMDACVRFAPSPLWAEKLARLHVAHEWAWGEQEAEFEVVASELTFKVEIASETFEGQIDAILRDKHGRMGFRDYKSTTSSVAPSSDYWSFLRLGTQPGVYDVAFLREFGRVADFIEWDVMRKPSIKPKALTKTEVTRMGGEIAEAGDDGRAIYYGESFGLDELNTAIENKRETDRMYGARLTASIGDDPASYFQRMPIYRTDRDRDALQVDLIEQVQILRFATANQLWPRNPDACGNYNTRCEFFSLCSRGEIPRAGEVPEGFVGRNALHPELAPL